MISLNSLSANVENAKYMDSIEGKTKSLKASFEALSTSTISSGFVKTVVGGGAGVLDALTSVTETLGTIPTMAMAATTALSLMGKNGGKQLICLFVRNCEVAQRCRL